MELAYLSSSGVSFFSHFWTPVPDRGCREACHLASVARRSLETPLVEVQG